MGCGLSTRLNPENAATLSRRRIIDINSQATSKNIDRGGDDSVLSSAQRSQKSVSSSQGKDVKHGEGEEEEEGEKVEEGYQNEILILPRSPSFREYCIASSNSRNRSFSDNLNDNDSASSIKNSGDEDSTNKPEDKKERKKKERRILGLRNVMHKGMHRRKRK
ncbi:uncharacterized protein LOC129298739 [Prosopis cineraria]|uniref:uncharacterized protein LOC129298739 n=1 Tax=Prosopis cineraria TaxID=364024 RepID=UPI00240EFAC1|nr:uncharacterized protein LOC129298739 [Prosopis cineraria]